ncbi:valine--tRNA ligase [Contarinia nasturtii]|uniref:valine--tRNA ligase n=1 Tax=Contarinia nasturtii TaxID=265458 RepID=UPI0012D38E87|nr:valine--tRNA ligase [Contarinia nasturtii]
MNRIYIFKEFTSGISFLYKSRRYKSFCDVYNVKELENDVTAFDRSNQKLFPNVERKPQSGEFNSILPPPNVTGNLHLGHAMMITVLDVICRWKHLNGYNVMLVPGLDHAGIATQVVVEQQLKKELGVSRFDIGKRAFVDRVLKWKNEKGGSIKDDIYKMGTIFNWEKEYFTMDERQSFAVAEAFIRLFDEKLIYRKESLVNWSFALKSTISDIEIENISINGPTKISVPGYNKAILFGEIYNISYKLSSDENEYITVATTRPETILGDTAVAVNPNDERYAHLQNKNTQLWHPFRHEWIPLIFDDSVTSSLGTGAVKITPSHSKVDYEIAQRHKLPLVSVFDQNGMILNRFDGFSGLPRFIAREKILETLANMGLFKSKADHKLDLPICSRSKDVIEMLTKPQWFLNCAKMSEEAIQVLKTGQLTIEPSKFENEWKRWFENTRDWCLSRQIWWGHQIPAYKCTYENKTIWIAAHSKDEALNKCAKEFGETFDNMKITIEQDEDVLDTWFSSGILPFSLLGWPNEKQLNNSSYPLDVLVSGHDILLLWIARMVMLSTHFQKDVPFRKVFCHGIICDEEGRKMSKSRGNIVTPDQIINGASIEDLKEDLRKMYNNGTLTQNELNRSLRLKEAAFPKGIPSCGVDALRLTLCNSDVREHFIKFDPKNCEKNYRFLNKIWNVTKFTLLNCTTFSMDSTLNPIIGFDELSLMDKWILSRLSKTIVETSTELNSLNAGCASLWKTFFYENLCDVYVEAAKYNFHNNLAIESQAQCEVLKTCLAIGLRYMGIFTPFISNELLAYLPNQMEFKPEKWINDALENEVNQVLEVCSEIRKMKSPQNILRSHGPRSYIFSTDAEMLKILKQFQRPINSLTFSVETSILPMEMDAFGEKEKLLLTSILNERCSIAISTDVKIQLVDIQERNKKKLAKLQENLKFMIDKISRDKYCKKATSRTKEKDSLKIRDIEDQIKTLTDLIERQ